MRDNFAACLAQVLVFEGGKVNDPEDPGGRTNRGITQAVYDRYRKSHGFVRQTVYEISDNEVAWIYRTLYWDNINGNILAVGLDLALFDLAVNSGPGRALAWKVKTSNCSVPAQIDSICTMRLGFLHRLAGWARFGKGWNSRVSTVRVKALHMAYTAGYLPK